jgi:hypothetical protein
MTKYKLDNEDVQKLIEVCDTLKLAMQYIEPAALKNSKKGDEAWALMTHLMAAQLNICAVGEFEKRSNDFIEFLKKEQAGNA